MQRSGLSDPERVSAERAVDMVVRPDPERNITECCGHCGPASKRDSAERAVDTSGPT